MSRSDRYEKTNLFSQQCTDADHAFEQRDFPFEMGNTRAVDHLLSVAGLSDDARAAILGGTAAELLGIKQTA